MTFMPSLSFPGRLIRAPQVLVSGTSYSKPTNCIYLIVELMAAGGGGGGAQASASQSSVGDAGGSGGYARKFFDVTAVAGPFAYAIGTAGSGGAGNTGAAAGTSGGNTTFTVSATTVTTRGGSSGLNGADTVSLGYGSDISSGSLPTNGDLNVRGEAGFAGHQYAALVGCSGTGSSTIFGGGGLGRTNLATGVGRDAQGFGAGGGGALALNGNGPFAGGAGAGGVIIVWEFA